MSIKTFIQRFVDVRSDERKPVRILFFHSLLLGFSTSFYFVAANSYFIKKVNIADIPYAYIIAGILGYLLVQFFKFLLRKLGSIFSLFIVLILFAVTCFALYFGHFFLDETSTFTLLLAYAGFIFIFPFAGLFVLGFSGICLQFFNLSQNKRLLALIGTGEVIASIIGYLVVPLITKFLGTPVYLFLFSGILILLSIFPIYNIYTLNKSKFTIIKGTKKSKLFNTKIFKQDKFYRTLAIVAFFSVMAIYFSDYVYLVSVRSLSSLSGIEIANIVAVLFGIIKIGELLFSLFSSNIISTRGMKFSLLLLPLALVLFSILSVISILFFNDVLLFVIIFFLMAKWSDRVLRKGVYSPSTKVLYQVTEPAERIQLQTNIEGTISQLSIILSGIILLLVSKFQKHNDPTSFFYSMSFICLFFSVVWALFVFSLYNGYKKKIHAYLHTIHKPAYAMQQKNIATMFKDWLNSQEQILLEQEKDFAKNIFENDFKNNTLSKQQIIQFLAVYNPSLQGFLKNTNENLLQKKIVRYYFSNDNFFNKILIIRFLETTEAIKKFNLLYELYEATDFTVKIEIFKALNRLNFVADEHDAFYFTQLCKTFVSEIIWAELAISDIAHIPSNQLANCLKEYSVACKNHLLDILKVIHGNESILVVQQVLNEADEATEGNIFAVELLENILQQRLKNIIIPLFEPIPQQLRWNKLSKYFNIYHLSDVERLKEILLRDFKLINIKIKQEALLNYYTLTQDENIIAAFAYSKLEELQAITNKIKSSTDNNSYLLKSKLIEDLNLNKLFNTQYLQYLMRDAVAIEQKNVKQNTHHQHPIEKDIFKPILKITNPSNKQRASIDMLSLGILFQLKY